MGESAPQPSRIPARDQPKPRGKSAPRPDATNVIPLFVRRVLRPNFRVSRFENYTRASRNYDRTRQPIGREIVLGALALGPRPPARQRVLDAGCGTGNYLAALAPRVGEMVGVEPNPGMRARARAKVRGRANVRLLAGSLPALPLPDASCDGVLVNFVLHHLETGEDDAFTATRQALAECRRALAPGGVLIIQTCTPRQYREGYWYAALIPRAIERAVRRYLPVEALVRSLNELGLRAVERWTPLDAVLQGEAYLDPRGPFRREWRDGDSSWALAEEAELRRALERLDRMIADGSIRAFLAARETLRRACGQATFVLARQPAS